jgi:hypothetical protein
LQLADNVLSAPNLCPQRKFFENQGLRRAGSQAAMYEVKTDIRRRVSGAPEPCLEKPLFQLHNLPLSSITNPPGRLTLLPPESPGRV